MTWTRSLLMARLLRAVIFIAFIFSAKGVVAAGTNWYVHKGATGSNNGTSWTNAWNEMNQISFSTVACGDTVWLAGGTYTTSMTINKACTAVSVLNIFRVLSTDLVPTAAAGWNSSFDSQVVFNNTEIDFTGGSAYVTMDGRIGDPINGNYTLGISIQSTGNNYAILETNSGPSNSHITFAHIEAFGPSCVAAGNCSATADALGLHNFSNPSTFVTIDHCWLHRWAEIINNSGDTNFTLQYSQLDTDVTTTAEHADIAYVNGGTNYIIRYNRIYSSQADGFLFESGNTYTSMDWYGNLIYHSGGSLIDFKSGSTCSGIHLYNNVFLDDGQDGYGGVHPSFLYFQSALTGTSAVENNVFQGVRWNVGAIPTQDYNAFDTATGKQDTGPHSFTYTIGNQFVNSPSSSNPNAADFRLTSTGATTFQNGVTLSAPYNVDADGNIRGASGHWYIGESQFGSGSGPQPPTGLLATVQ